MRLRPLRACSSAALRSTRACSSRAGSWGGFQSPLGTRQVRPPQGELFNKNAGVEPTVFSGVEKSGVEKTTPVIKRRARRWSRTRLPPAGRAPVGRTRSSWGRIRAGTVSRLSGSSCEVCAHTRRERVAYYGGRRTRSVYATTPDGNGGGRARTERDSLSAAYRGARCITGGHARRRVFGGKIASVIVTTASPKLIHRARRCTTGAYTRTSAGGGRYGGGEPRARGPPLQIRGAHPPNRPTTQPSVYPPIRAARRRSLRAR